MTKIWMRRAGVAAALGAAMLAGAAQATLVTYNFTGTIDGGGQSGFDGGFNGVTSGGTLNISLTLDTAKLLTESVYDDGNTVYYVNNSDPAGTATRTVSGSPVTLPTFGSPQLGRAMSGYSQYYRNGNFISLSLGFGSPSVYVYPPEGGYSYDYDGMGLSISFFGSETMLVDGITLPKPGTGIETAGANYYYTQQGYGPQGQINISRNAGVDATGSTTFGAAADVPEPGALALLGLGVIGVAIRRRRGGLGAPRLSEYFTLVPFPQRPYLAISVT